MAILVTGGAGYIGSHMVLKLLEDGEEVVVIDNLSTGRRSLVPEDARLLVADICESEKVQDLIETHGVECVIHFAGSIVVPDSVSDPLGYYNNNTVKSRGLIETCIKTGVGKFIFSSTAAVYGSPERVPVKEDDLLKPINPYGRSKLMTEWMLQDCAVAYGLKYVALRYFNVAGADPKGRSGQATPKATHLIKTACEVATGKRAQMSVFGTDYPTPDGTCIRDYIHVTDLTDAHAAALSYLRDGGASGEFNCGYGRGYSVLEVIAALNRVVGREIRVERAGRRAGDPAMLVAGTDKIRKTFAWQPRYENLDFIVETALAWERALKQ